jgi:adenylylsulfate kinase-like enzyme
MKGEGCTVWLTGYRGSGKRAISDELTRMLLARQVPVEQLDFRTPGLEVFQSADPTDASRYERRLAFMAGTLNRHGVSVIVATMSPSRELRDLLRQEIPHFMEVYVKRPAPVAGQHYEEPLSPDVEVAAGGGAATAAAAIIRALEERGCIPQAPEALAAEEEEQQIIRRLKDFGYM